MKCFAVSLLLACSAFAAEVKIENTFLEYEFHYRDHVQRDLLWLKEDKTYVALYSAREYSIETFVDPLKSGTFAYSFSAAGAQPTLNFTRDSIETVQPYFPGHTYWGYGMVEYYTFLRPDTSNPRQNISLRAQSAPGKPAIGGFTLTGNQWVLVRVLGPGLKQFGVNDVAPKPKLTIYKGNDVLAENTGWTKQGDADVKVGRKALFELVGAFPLSEADSDCAYLGYFKPGVYTIHGQDADGKTGEVLIEVYYLPINEGLAGQVVP